MNDSSDRQIEPATYCSHFPAEVRQENINSGNSMLHNFPSFQVSHSVKFWDEQTMGIQ